MAIAPHRSMHHRTRHRATFIRQLESLDGKRAVFDGFGACGQDFLLSLEG